MFSKRCLGMRVRGPINQQKYFVNYRLLFFRIQVLAKRKFSHPMTLVTGEAKLPTPNADGQTEQKFTKQPSQCISNLLVDNFRWLRDSLHRMSTRTFS